jgi:hypothetical protein
MKCPLRVVPFIFVVGSRYALGVGPESTNSWSSRWINSGPNGRPFNVFHLFRVESARLWCWRVFHSIKWKQLRRICIFRLFSLASVGAGVAQAAEFIRAEAGWGGASCLIDFFHFPLLSLSAFMFFFFFLHPKRRNPRQSRLYVVGKIGKWNLHSSAGLAINEKMWRHGPTIRAAYRPLFRFPLQNVHSTNFTC